MNSQPQGVLELFLSVDEAQLMMEALADMPFKAVYRLIGDLNNQANGYDPREFNGSFVQSYRISGDDMRLILAALGNLPFNRVHRLVSKLHGQIRARLESGPGDSARVFQ
jgi:hypothetical protein